MTQTTLETLKAMRCLLSEPKSWFKGNFAANLVEDPTNSGNQIHVQLGGYASEEGYVEPWLRDDAQCFCLIGAGLRVTQARDWDYYLPWESEIKQTLRESSGNHPAIPFFNDWHETTHEDVLKILDQTIARVEKEENAPKCPKCGTPLHKIMWYSCALEDCPSGLGSDVTMKV